VTVIAPLRSLGPHALLFTLWLAALLLAAPARAQQDAEVDPVALAAVLVRDGQLDRAAIALAEVEPAALEPASLRTFHRLQGLLAQDRGDAAAAAAAFQSALGVQVPATSRPRQAERAAAWDAARAEEQAQERLTRLYLAQALLSLDPPQAAAAVEQLDLARLEDRAGYWQLRARAHTALSQWEPAWQALEEGRRRFPDEAAFMRQLIFVLVELGLYRQAVEHGSAWMDRYGASPQAVLAIAEALRRAAAGDAHSSQLAEAQRVLEEGRLRFPEDPEIRRLLARVLLERQQPASAARLLQEAAISTPALAAESAEAWRRAGRLDRALYMNAQVPESDEKTRQRLGILLEQGAFSRVTALEARLSRLGLLSDDRIAYGLAYAWFRLGQPDAAEAHLQRISDPEVFRAATELRAAMARCEADGGCL
jgi:predicted Zn-dependent protease